MKALVLSVSIPKVCSIGYYEILVCIPIKKHGYVYRQKTTVFRPFLPKIGTWIDLEAV